MGKTVLIGVFLTSIIVFVLYDIGFNNSAGCEAIMNKSLDFMQNFARHLSRWSDKLFQGTRYKF